MIVEPGIADDLGQAEVGDPELRPEVQQQVARLDVPVHDPRLVGVLERERRLPAQPGHRSKYRLRSNDRSREMVVAASVTSPSEPDSGEASGRSATAARSSCSPLGRGWAGTLLIAKAAKLPDQRGEALPVDELHRVIVHAALAADRMHRHDPLVLHVRGRQRLGLETLEAARVDGRGEGQRP